MNTGQTMLTIGALTLLSIMTLNYYGSIARSGRHMSQSGAGIFATSLATSYIERAQNMCYDSATVSVSNVISNANLFTPYNRFGREADSEKNINKFNDFDDFDKYTDTIKAGGILGTFVAKFSVYYVNTADLNTKVLTRTFVKRMDLSVWRCDPKTDTKEAVTFDTAKASCIMGYFKFN
jgi:hypothetical protein